MMPQVLLISRLRLAPLLYDGHHLRRSLSDAAAKLSDELPPGAPPPTSDSRLFGAGLSWSVDERSLTDAFCSFGTVTEVRGQMVHGLGVRQNAVEDVTRKPPHRTQARSLFDEVPVRDVVTCSAAIYRHARSGLFHESAGLFVSMMRAVHNVLFEEAVLAFKRLCCCFGSDPNNVVTVINVAQAYAGCGDPGMCKSVHAYAVKIGFDLDVSVTNSILGMYLSFWDIEIGREIFRKIIFRNVVTWTMMMGFLLEKGLVSWTAMVSVYIGSERALKGMHLFGKMRCEDIFVIDSVTLVSLSTGCYETAKFDLCVQLHGYSYKSVYDKCGYASLAHKIFDDMISRDVVSWNTLILSYGINGHGEQAVALFNDMEESSEEQDSVIYLNTMLACSHSGQVDDGLIIFKKMNNEELVNLCKEHIGCLVDMLAKAGRLGEAAEVASLTSNEGANHWNGRRSPA
ncbi:hypothetical protein BDA96_03G255700 [Sorghum bicolor]|uniref:Pentatricopeptide repeat-containing protein n=2 Tax=Sorghum bicolor TaxID=4558 RepID=A0A921UNE4_SORBI|nr:hypothetical protein BDA96_03G255700 [Sorghum bicolor]OQU87225.1 hypothetical protein SORBI_3003G236150 [Sorghum bicolor]